MKLRIKNLIGIALIASALATTGCSKDFFNRPPENTVSVGQFYQTTEQIQAGTNVLYSAPWFGLNGKAFLAIGDLQSGNAVSFPGTDGTFSAFGTFSQGNATPAIQSAWNSLFTVVAQCNALLSNLASASIPASVPQSVVNDALGEAHLMRAAAYFYLVRLWGNVPIVTNPLDIIDTFSTVRTNPVTDVYKFIINDLKFAEANCTPNVAATGHGSSGTASGMLAKVYLYMQNYDSAKYYAEKVINSGEFKLVPGTGGTVNYNNMFEQQGNNCSESMLALQWSGAGGYGFGNQIQSVIALNTALTGTGDGWAELGPSFDLQDAYNANGDIIRRHGTIMVRGDFYSELMRSNGGYTVPADANAQGSHAALKKYVVGSPTDGNGGYKMQAANNNTYLLRYADMYLIAAEARLAIQHNIAVGTGIDTNYTCNDPVAVNEINAIRQRADVVSFTDNFSYKQLLNERRLEFAIEGEYWYDLQRIDGFNVSHHPTAIKIISSQNRAQDGDNTATTEADLTPSYVKPTDANFLLPIPSSETAIDPALLQPPVPYDFSNNN